MMIIYTLFVLHVHILTSPKKKCPQVNLPQVGTSETERRRRRPNKGKKCPTVEQIKAKMGEGMEGDLI